MVALGHCLSVASVFACVCISRCNSQQQCETFDGEITYPDRCESGGVKDLCRKGQYLKVSSVLCDEENGSDDDRCLNCETETYMPHYNFCTECWITTQCKDNEEESRAPTSTTDRECRPKLITAPSVTPDCPVCECFTRSSCPPCPTAADLTTDLYSPTSGQETSDGSTTVVSTATNATNSTLYQKGNDDYWKWIACGLGGLVVVAFLVIAILVCILCRTRRGRKQGVCPRCKRKCDNGGYEMKDRNPQDGCGRYEDEAHRQIEMGVRNSQDGCGRYEDEAHRQIEMGVRNSQDGCGRYEDEAHRQIEMGVRNSQDGCGRYEDEAHRQIEMGVRNSQDGCGRHEDEAHRQIEMGVRNSQDGCGRYEDEAHRQIEMGVRNSQDGCGRYEDEAHRQIEMGVRNSQDGGGLELVHEDNEMASRNPPNRPGAIEPDEGRVGEVHPEVPRHNYRGISSRRKDEALHSNLDPTGGHLNPGKSSENRTYMSIQPAIKSPSILTNDESGSFDTSRNTPNTPNAPNTQPLLSNRPEINSLPPLRRANMNTKAGNGTNCFQYKPRESLQPLLSNSISGFETNNLHLEEARRNDTSSLPPSQYDSSCILEADESTEKPCERTTFCEECHITLVKDEISINDHGKVFDELNISRKKRDELFHDNHRYGIREQIGAVLRWWLQANEKQSIVKLFRALEESGNADVIKVFKKKFNVKQIERKNDDSSETR